MAPSGRSNFKRNRSPLGCFLGLIQISLVLCITTSILAVVIGGRLWWHSSDALRMVSFARPDGDSKPAMMEPVAFQIAGAPDEPSLVPAAGSNLPPPTPTSAPSPLPNQFNQGTPATEPYLAEPQPTATPAPIDAFAAVEDESAPVGEYVNRLPEPDWQATRLVIPTLSLDSPVVFSPIAGETWQVSHLTEEVGHLERTARPGADSNLVLAGHVTLAPDGRPGPFLNLQKLSKGDQVTVYRGNELFTYRIIQLTTVKPTDIEVTYPTDEARLTLITCLNYNRELGRYEDRLVAVGILLDE